MPGYDSMHTFLKGSDPHLSELPEGERAHGWLNMDTSRWSSPFFLSGLGWPLFTSHSSLAALVGVLFLSGFPHLRLPAFRQTGLA